MVERSHKVPGTHWGGQRAAQRNKELYGESFYKDIGKLGGLKSRGGGFAANPELAREAGRKGGKASQTPEKRAETRRRMLEIWRRKREKDSLL